MQAMMMHKRDRTDSSRGHRAGLRPIAVALAGLALGIVDGRFFNAIDAVTLDATSLQPLIDGGFASDLTEALDFFNRNGLSGVSNAALGDAVRTAR